MKKQLNRLNITNWIILLICSFLSINHWFKIPLPKETIYSISIIIILICNTIDSFIIRNLRDNFYIK